MSPSGVSPDSPRARIATLRACMLIAIVAAAQVHGCSPVPIMLPPPPMGAVRIASDGSAGVKDRRHAHDVSSHPIGAMDAAAPHSLVDTAASPNSGPSARRETGAIAAATAEVSGRRLRFFRPISGEQAAPPAKGPRLRVVVATDAPRSWRAARTLGLDGVNIVLLDDEAVSRRPGSAAGTHPERSPDLFVVMTRGREPASKVLFSHDLPMIPRLSDVLAREDVPDPSERFHVRGADPLALRYAPRGATDHPMAVIQVGAALPADRALARLCDVLHAVAMCLIGAEPAVRRTAAALSSRGESGLVKLGDQLALLEQDEFTQLTAAAEPPDWRVTATVASAMRSRNGLLGENRPTGYAVAKLRTIPSDEVFYAVREMDALEERGLWRIDELLKGGLVRLRYSAPDNFLKRPLYPSWAACYLTPQTAAALFRAHDLLSRQGLGLLVYDCYRPLSVQRAMWEALPDSRFVAPAGPNGGPHNRGVAVDVGLVDARLQPLEMPSEHDDFSSRAFASTTTGIAYHAIKNRAHLREAMEKEGFTINQAEWWHFARGGGIPLDDSFPADHMAEPHGPAATVPAVPTPAPR